MRTRFFVLSVLFFTSGATGLLYEVTFSKLLGYVFGASAYAISTVLAAFMGGISLGAHFGGKFARSIRHPVLAYGVLELIVGLSCVVSPFALDGITKIYITAAHSFPNSLALITAVRWALAFSVVVIPTIAMGATLPILSKAIPPHLISALYSANTLGGACGSLSTYVLLPALGIRHTMMFTSVMNGLIFLIVLAYGSRLFTTPVIDAPEAPFNSSSIAFRTLLYAFLSGFLVFACEVIDTHLLALIIGTSAYAFSLMLAVFLVFLALGAYVSGRLTRQFETQQLLPFTFLTTSIAFIVTIPLWDKVPDVFSYAGKSIQSWHGRELCRALVAISLLAIPTTAMGTTFPVLLAEVSRRTNAAQNIAKVTSVNTIGSILGCVIGGYFLLPKLGAQHSLIFISFVFLALATISSLKVQERKHTTKWAIFATAVPLLLLPKWNLAKLTNGANVYFTAGPVPDKIPFVREDIHGGVTTVAQTGNISTMYTNGKFQGDDGPEMIAQKRFAHFPSLFVNNYEHALVIGLGTGTTLATVSAYPFRRIDVAEISPSIVEAASIFFAKTNGMNLSDPRIRLTLNDGRNVLLTEQTQYDLIAIELTSVWFAGAASLYSQEFYQLAQSRMQRAGILQQWIQLHHIRSCEVATILRTLRSVFQHVALFVGGAQGIVVASNQPLTASRTKLQHLEMSPQIQHSLDHRTLVSLLDDLIASDSDLDRFIDDQATNVCSHISTDDNLYLEYETPKGNVFDYRKSLQNMLNQLYMYKTSNPAERHLVP